MSVCDLFDGLLSFSCFEPDSYKHVKASVSCIGIDREQLILVIPRFSVNLQVIFFSEQKSRLSEESCSLPFVSIGTLLPFAGKRKSKLYLLPVNSIIFIELHINVIISSQINGCSTKSKELLFWASVS